MRIRFQQSLDDLKEQLLVMAGLAEQAIQRAIEAYRVRDLSICDLGEPERDRHQPPGAGGSTKSSLDLLAMEQPMAIDLRFILSVIKINADLERVGDAAKSISERVRNMEQMAAADLPVDIPKMASLAAEMVRKSLQSFIEADAGMALAVLTMDDAVDAMKPGGLQVADQGDGGAEPSGSAGAECADDQPCPGARGRPRHQHRRGRDLLGARRRRAPPQKPEDEPRPSCHGVRVGWLRRAALGPDFAQGRRCKCAGEDTSAPLTTDPSPLFSVSGTTQPVTAQVPPQLPAEKSRHAAGYSETWRFSRPCSGVMKPVDNSTRPFAWNDEAAVEPRFRRVQQGVPPTGRALPGMPLEMPDPDGGDSSPLGSVHNAQRGRWWRPASRVGRVFFALCVLAVLGGLATGGSF